MRNWEDKHGNKRVSPEVMADNVYFCGGKKNGTQAEIKPVAYTNMADADGEIPF